MLRGRALTTKFLPDLCYIGTRSGSGWGSAPADDTYTYASTATNCFVETANGLEVADGSETVVVDVLIYVPASTAVTSSNRLRVTTRFRESIKAEYYKIIGNVRQERNMTVLPCQLMHGGSAR